jgi:N-acetyl-gamma-glutamyl-phosphate reductase
MGARVSVAGASGYAGGELLRLLASHPAIQFGTIAAGGSAGRPVAALHRNLAGLGGLAGRPLAAADAAGLADADLVFLALPAGESAKLAARLPVHIKVVDLGPDFRLADPSAWSRHYPGSHPGQWACGIPELPGARQRVRQADRVAVPGCYATAAILALAPLVASGLASPTDVVVVAASGTSGAGREPRPDLLASEVMGSVSGYAAGGSHRHIPEIEQALLAARPASADGPVRVTFTPLLAPMPRGILAVCTAPLARQPASSADLRDALAAGYAGEPFVSVLPEGTWPATGAVAGSNAVHLQAVADTRAGRAVAIAAIDNLGKGAAGQAVQNANLMLGLPETAGLTAAGVAP